MKTLKSGILIIILSAVFVLSPAFAQQGSSEQESNDSRRKADSIHGCEIRGEIGKHGDKDDWFVLEGQEGDYPTFYFNYDWENARIKFRIYDDDEMVLETDGIQVRDYDGTPIGNFRCRIKGTCYIHAHAAYKNCKYGISIKPGGSAGKGEEEPNDSMDEATPVSSSKIEGYLSEDDEDWYQFLVDKDEHLTFTIKCENHCWLEIYSDSEHVGTAENPWYYSWQTVTCHVPGTCYLRVHGDVGDYSIVIDPNSCDGPSEIEPNETKDRATEIDSYRIEGSIGNGDVDWYVLNGQEGYYPIISVNSDDLDSWVTLWFDVYDDDLLAGKLRIEGDMEHHMTVKTDEFNITGTCSICVSFKRNFNIEVHEYDYTIRIEP